MSFLYRNIASLTVPPQAGVLVPKTHILLATRPFSLVFALGVRGQGTLNVSRIRYRSIYFLVRFHPVTHPVNG
jgi:hypothetical protein